MKLHPRHGPVESARLQVGSAVAAAVKEHNLTDVEVIGILLGEASSRQLYALRLERHPCCGGPADVVCGCRGPRRAK